MDIPEWIRQEILTDFWGASTTFPPEPNVSEPLTLEALNKAMAALRKYRPPISSKLRVVTSPHMSTSEPNGYAKVKRMLLERLFKRPWKPFEKVKLVPKFKVTPMEDVYIVGDMLICHPSIERRIIEGMEVSNAYHDPRQTAQLP